MAKFQVDTKVTGELTGRLQALIGELDQGKPRQEKDGKGNTSDAVKELDCALEKTEAAMKILIEKTIDFLIQTTDTFDESDKSSASAVSDGGK